MNPDAKQPDAPPDAAEFKGFMAPEGGEIKWEYVNYVNGNAGIRVTSFLYKKSPYYQFLSFNGCTDADPVGSTIWPSAQAPDREYLDPGLVLFSGGPTTYTSRARTMAGTDNIGRTHPANMWGFYFPGPSVNEGSQYITPATTYDVTFTGSADVPGQVFEDVIYVPENYMLTNPTFGPYQMVRGQDAVFQWNKATQTPPAGYEVMALVGFAGANGVSVLCVEPDDGSLTVPAAMVEKVFTKYPNGGVIVRQTFTHVVRELVDKNGPTGRRIDFIGVWCNNAPWTPAPTP